MAFDLVAAGGYGTGKLGDVTDPVGHINTVAKITGIEVYPNGNPTYDYSGTVGSNNWSGGVPVDGSDENATLGISRISLSILDEGIYGGFAVGDEILFQVAGYSGADSDDGKALTVDVSSSGGESSGGESSSDESSSDEKHKVGFFSIATIIAVGQKHDTGWQYVIVDKDLTELKNAYVGAYTFATSIPHFRNLTLNEGCYLSPLGDDGSGSGQGLKGGFILAFKCSGTLTLNGGHIDLRNKGFPVDMTAYRPLFAHEANGTLDTEKYSGWENSQLKDRFKINCGDGAAFICVKKLVVANSASRIGNPNTTGVQFCRGSANSRAVTPDNATNIGGSTILIAAGTIEDFSPKIIAKYRDSTADAGKGLAACYIASNTILRNDEGLYAYDNISNNNRVTQLGIHSFGDGSSGSFAATSQVNNYASVTAVDETGQVFTVANKTSNGTAPFAIGALVMLHCSAKYGVTRQYHGRFFLAHILGINDNEITLDTAASGYQKNVDDYVIQLITIPQFVNFTLATEYTAVPKFNGAQGGIFAIAVSDTCDLTGGQINVEGKGGAQRYGSAGIRFIGNAQDRNKLPIGEGHGSVFILAKNLKMNANTRIGATYSGAEFGGEGGYTFTTQRAISPTTGHTGGYRGIGLDYFSDSGISYSFRQALGGSGDNPPVTYHTGGYGSNGTHNLSAYVVAEYYTPKVGLQGAHIMIIADTITGFNMAAISTGGSGGGTNTGSYHDSHLPGFDGGAGYGGGGAVQRNYGEPLQRSPGAGGGYNGGGSGNGDGDIDSSDTGHYYEGGGSSGWAYIFCNHVSQQNTTDIVL